MPAFPDDYIDLVEPAYIFFGPTRGKFIFGCVVGAFKGDGTLSSSTGPAKTKWTALPVTDEPDCGPTDP